jgi:hypothetical protein
MADTFFVSLDMESARETAEKAVVGRSWTGELIDEYSVALPDGHRFVQLVYEKYYLRLGNSLTLTVTLDDVTGKTRVHCIGGGGKGAFLSDDFDTAEDFELVVADALAPWRF